jgi:paraquat-inducible protein A
MSKKFYIIYTIFSLILILTSWIAYSAACNYERQTHIFTDHLKTEDKIVSVFKQITEGILFGQYSGHSKEKQELEAIIKQKQYYKNLSIIATVSFFIMMLMFLVFTYKTNLFLPTMLMISLICLLVGLFAPILMMVAYQEVPVFGKVIFMFQSKGIISTIETLWESDNLFVALPLIIFSVMIPILKTILMGIALIKPLAAKSIEIIKPLGKWSMADVFVVALLLTYFTTNQDNSTHSEVGIGLYFFLVYVILSMIVALLIAGSDKGSK